MTSATFGFSRVTLGAKFDCDIIVSTRLQWNLDGKVAKGSDFHGAHDC